MALLSGPGRRSAGPARFGIVFVLCSLALLATPLMSEPSRAAAGPTEYQLKAVFLFNFAQFVEWPPGAFRDAAEPLVIGVLGQDPFGPYLDDVVRGEQVKGRPLAVKRYRKLEEVDGCQILFVSTEESARAATALASHAVLTVSDASRPAQRGAIVQFVDARNRIRLRIDVDSAQAAGLTISSKLLRSADVVRSGGD